jgi:hypothetical protein
MHRYLRAPADAVQQIRHAPFGVAHVKQPANQHGDPRQRPPLVFHPAVRGGTGVQLAFQPGQPGLIEATPATAGPLGPQSVAPVPPPGLLPLVGRLRRYPQPPRHLPGRHVPLEQVSGLHPYRFAAGAPSCVKAAAIGVPHAFGIDPQPASIMPTRRTNIDLPRPFGLSSGVGQLVPVRRDRSGPAAAAETVHGRPGSAAVQRTSR